MWHLSSQPKPLSRKRAAASWAASIEASKNLGIFLNQKGLIDQIALLRVGERMRFPNRKDIIRTVLNRLNSTHNRYFTTREVDNKAKLEVERTG